jgi:P4 family phage/plasmid primase-like protien
MIDALQARRFMRALCGVAPADPDPTVIFQTVDDEKKKLGLKDDRDGYAEHKAGTLATLGLYLRAQNQRGAGIFVQVNAGGRGDRLITAVRALFIDDDGKDGRPSPDLSALPPSITVRTSIVDGRPKLHHYWLLVEGEAIEAWQPAMLTLAARLGTDAGVAKPSQPMRVPGFYHHKGEPQRSELLVCRPERRFTIAEVLAAFVAAPPVADEQAERFAAIDAAIAGKLPPPSRLVRAATLARAAAASGADSDDSDDASGDDAKTDGHDLDSADHNEKSEAAFAILVDWLKRIGITPIHKASKPRFLFLPGGCPRNPEHTDAALIATRTGNFAAKCFHESCGGHQRATKHFRDFKMLLGGWSEIKLGDHIDLANRLRADLRATHDSDIVTDNPHDLLHYYDRDSKLWTPIDDTEAYNRLTRYSGLSTGARGTPLKLKDGDVHGALRAAKRLSTIKDYFSSSVGLAVGDEWVWVDRDGIHRTALGPEHRARFRIPPVEGGVAFDATPTKFLRALHDMLAEADGSPRASAQEIIDAIAEALGLGLLGLGAEQDAKHVLLQGPPDSSKSTFLKIVSALFPPTAQTAMRLHDLQERFRPVALTGKRLVTCAELPARDLLEVESVKAVLTGDAIPVEEKGKPMFTIKPRALWVMACNELPAASDASGAFGKRFLLIELRRRFLAHPTRGEGQAVQGLAEALIRDERAAILGWALRAAAAYMARGRRLDPTDSRAAIEEWSKSDAIVGWLAERVVVDPAARTSREDLWEAFKEWCDARRYKPMSFATFRRRLAAAGHHGRRDPRGGMPLRLVEVADPLASPPLGADWRTTH